MARHKNGPQFQKLYSLRVRKKIDGQIFGNASTVLNQGTN